MLTLRRAHVVHFPNRTASEAARRFQALFEDHVVPAAITGTDVARISPGGHLVLIFPILGDDRIPAEVERWIGTVGAPFTYAVCVSGDLRTGQTTSPVAEEAHRLLGRRGGTPVARPLLLEAPVDWDATAAEMAGWLEEQLEGRAAPSPDVQRSSGGVGPAAAGRGGPTVEPSLRRIIDLLGAVPVTALDERGRCRVLSLHDAGRYPRSLLAGASARSVGLVLGALHDLPALEVLGLPFTDLRRLSEPLPARLVGLDLRGNALEDWTCLARTPDLVALNLAGCDLERAPDEVFDLGRLRTLVLAKNRISAIGGGLARLQQLERLTLYRNALTVLPEVVSALHGLRLLNIGATFVAELPPSLAELNALEVLGLRLLPLSELPTFLAHMSSLRHIDRSKTTALVPPALTTSGVLLSNEGMPRWTWDDDLEREALHG